MTDLRVSFPKPCDEAWEAMKPVGCDRVCARCDRVIHDLAHYTGEEAEALLRNDPDTCVRAKIDAQGIVALKPGGAVKRFVLATGAAGLLAAGQPAFAGQETSEGAITGRIVEYTGGMQVTVKGPHGATYDVKVDAKGRYWVGNLPEGNYKLTFRSCGQKWTVETVAVAKGEVTIPDQNDRECDIIIGALRIESSAG